jgi:hypothetical protein
VFVDGVLIPIRYLVNGRTIAQEKVDAVTYYHVELPRHDVVLADGLPCESYLDTGNRGAFAEAGIGWEGEVRKCSFLKERTKELLSIGSECGGRLRAN